MIADLEKKIKSYWAHTPAIVVVREIKRRMELPKWEHCPKDHIYVGISRRKSGDKVTTIKHKMEIVLDLRCKVEELPDSEYRTLGVIPFYISMVCLQCGEFSTRINIGCICQDCTDKSKLVK